MDYYNDSNNFNRNDNTNNFNNENFNNETYNGRRSNNNYELSKKKFSFIKLIGNVFKVLFLCLILLIFYFIFTEDGQNYIYKNVILKSMNISEIENNKYYREYDFDYVQLTNNFIAEDRQHLLNIYYTVVNSGMEDFTFACGKEYENCLAHVEEISNNSHILSNINAFVHPFNSFSSIETQFNTNGKVVLKVNKSYSSEEILITENKVNQIINSIKVDNKGVEEIIKTYHDYIINHTKYDSKRINEHIINYKSDLAYGSLIEGYALCGGYTDAMALFLEHYNILNYKVISDNHVWNAVYYNNNWYHLDLTWDDPVTTSGKDVLRNNYFLINTKKLLELEKSEHNFNQTIFSELTNN